MTIAGHKPEIYTYESETKATIGLHIEALLSQWEVNKKRTIIIADGNAISNMFSLLVANVSQYPDLALN